jgi:hypothetical protein
MPFFCIGLLAMKCFSVVQISEALLFVCSHVIFFQIVICVTCFYDTTIPKTGIKD